jgi:hypothetical protein
VLFEPASHEPLVDTPWSEAVARAAITALYKRLSYDTVSTFAAERLEVITQRVTATQNLVEVINKLNLYRDRRDRETMTELAEDVRKRFKMKMIEAKTTSPVGGVTAVRNSA